MRKLAAVTLGLVLLWAVATGATVYSHVFDWVTSTYGQAVSGASVCVYDAGTTTEATIYADNAGTVTADNPIITDSRGYYSFYVPAGVQYDVRYYDAAWGIDQTIEDGIPGGIARGDRTAIVFAYTGATISTDRYLYSGTVQGSGGRGAPMPKDGCVLAIATRAVATALSSTPYLNSCVYVNGDSALGYEEAFTDTTLVVWTAETGEGAVPFEAGDQLQVHLDFTGTLTVAYVIATVLLQFDE